MIPNHSRVCILTDNTAQFTVTSFPGQELVRIIPLHIEIEQTHFPQGKGLRLNELPTSAREGRQPLLLAPTTSAFRNSYSTLGKKYPDIISILISSRLSEAFSHAQQASIAIPGQDSHSLIDSQMTGVGLGWLVQAAAEAAQNGASITAIKRLINHVSSKIYTIICTQNLSYLIKSGHLDSTQATVAEMLGLSPLFAFEKGKLTYIQKARNMRHLVDLLEEFISEFSNINHIALLKGILPFEQEARLLRDRVQKKFPTAIYSELTLSNTLATIIGPHSLSLSVMEDD
jgi:DegV family protein with EDD domain